jgi:hypothetical protein
MKCQMFRRDATSCLKNRTGFAASLLTGAKLLSQAGDEKRFKGGVFLDGVMFSLLQQRARQIDGCFHERH